MELESELISRVGSDYKTGMIVIGNADAEMNENNYDVVCMCRHMSIYSYIYECSSAGRACAATITVVVFVALPCV